MTIAPYYYMILLCYVTAGERWLSQEWQAQSGRHAAHQGTPGNPPTRASQSAALCQAVPQDNQRGGRLPVHRLRIETWKVRELRQTQRGSVQNLQMAERSLYLSSISTFEPPSPSFDSFCSLTHLVLPAGTDIIFFTLKLKPYNWNIFV